MSDRAHHRGASSHRSGGSSHRVISDFNTPIRKPILATPDVEGAVADLPAVPPASVDVGFAFGGVHPGKLHAHGRVVDAHKVYYSIGMVGRYELHVGLRGQSIPLPGSPFQLQVRPGPASAAGTALDASCELPLQGTVGFDEGGSATADEAAAGSGGTSGVGQPPRRQGCVLKLHACDRYGNPCDSGGANIVATGVGRNSDLLKARSSDLGDGTYELVWCSERSGSYTVSVSIDGKPILGAPFPIRLVSDAPELNRTVASGRGLEEAHAGQPAAISIKLLDAFGNVAIGVPWLQFGLTRVKQGDKEDRNRWRSLDHPSDPYEGEWHEDGYEMRYTMTTAGHFDLYLWTVRTDGPPGADPQRAIISGSPSTSTATPPAPTPPARRSMACTRPT